MFDDLGQKNNQTIPREGREGLSQPLSKPQSPQSGAAQPNLGRDQFAKPAEPVSRPETAGKEKVEDIFSKIETGAGQPEKPEVFKPKEPRDLGVVGGQKMDDFQEEGGSDKLKKIIVLAVIIIGAGAVLAGGFWVVNKFFSQTGDLPADEKSGEEQGAEESLGPEIIEPVDKIIIEEPEAEIAKPLDSDQDGLSDEEEGQLGTNINSVDSDDDGLFDREEVRVYKTDPLDADSDGDSYLDGAEVKNGYNPNGEGKLYEFR